MNYKTLAVPVEPTEAMLQAGSQCIRDFLSEHGPYPRTKAMWKAMLAASLSQPEAPALENQEEPGAPENAQDWPARLGPAPLSQQDYERLVEGCLSPKKPSPTLVELMRKAPAAEPEGGAVSDDVREMIARIIDPPAFSEKYAPTLVSDYPKWLENKHKRLVRAVAKADAILAALSTREEAQAAPASSGEVAKWTATFTDSLRGLDARKEAVAIADALDEQASIIRAAPMLVTVQPESAAAFVALGKIGMLARSAARTLRAQSSPAPSDDGEPAAWRVRRLTDDPDEWQLRPSGAALDFGNPKRWEIQPLYTRPQSDGALREALEKVRNVTHHSTGYSDLCARRAAFKVADEALANAEGGE